MWHKWQLTTEKLCAQIIVDRILWRNWNVIFEWFCWNWILIRTEWNEMEFKETSQQQRFCIEFVILIEIEDLLKVINRLQKFYNEITGSEHILNKFDLIPEANCEI